MIGNQLTLLLGWVLNKYWLQAPFSSPEFSRGYFSVQKYLILRPFTFRTLQLLYFRAKENFIAIILA